MVRKRERHHYKNISRGQDWLSLKQRKSTLSAGQSKFAPAESRSSAGVIPISQLRRASTHSNNPYVTPNLLFLKLTLRKKSSSHLLLMLSCEFLLWIPWYFSLMQIHKRKPELLHNTWESIFSLYHISHRQLKTLSQIQTGDIAQGLDPQKQETLLTTIRKSYSAPSRPEYHFNVDPHPISASILTNVLQITQVWRDGKIIHLYEILFTILSSRPSTLLIF